MLLTGNSHQHNTRAHTHGRTHCRVGGSKCQWFDGHGLKRGWAGVPGAQRAAYGAAGRTHRAPLPAPMPDAYTP